MDLFLDPEAAKPLTGQLYEQLRHAIAGGRLLPGDQLVPSRQLAGELGVSRHTVTTAYGRLVAEGYAEGRAGGGSVVATASPAPPKGQTRRPPFARALGSRTGLRTSARPPTAAGSTCGRASRTPRCSRRLCGVAGSPPRSMPNIGNTATRPGRSGCGGPSPTG